MTTDSNTFLTLIRHTKSCTLCKKPKQIIHLTVQISPFVETRIGYTFLYIEYRLSLPIIQYSSCHPPEHQFAAIRYLFNCLSMYHLNTSERHNVWIIIQNIQHNNSFSINNAKEHYRKLSKKNVDYNNDSNNKGQNGLPSHIWEKKQHSLPNSLNLWI